MRNKKKPDTKDEIQLPREEKDVAFVEAADGKKAENHFTMIGICTSSGGLK